jgi:hypothetical protein
MEQGRNLLNLLSRGSGTSPPPRTQQQDSLDMISGPPDIHHSPRTHQHPPGHTPVNIDDLFRGIPQAPPQHQQSQPPPFSKPPPSTMQYQPNQPQQQAANSPSGTPMSSVTAGSGTSNLHTENRQNILSSLLAPVPQPYSNPGVQKPLTPPPGPKAPSPPSGESAGKLLLEQMVSGSVAHSLSHFRTLTECPLSGASSRNPQRASLDRPTIPHQDHHLANSHSLRSTRVYHHNRHPLHLVNRQCSTLFLHSTL